MSNKPINLICPVILCGGSGSRLFPLSRLNIPKQFLYLENNNYSLLQNTILRLINSSLNIKKIYLISNVKHINILNNQLNSLKNIYDDINFVIYLEPIGRNTCPAIGLIIKHFYNDINNQHDNLLFLPSDHLYDQKEFNDLLINAKNLMDNSVVLFGINPTYPETGFGYIEYDNNNKVISFKEKPNLETTQKYIDSGNFCWNSGMFMFNQEIVKIYCEKNYNTSLLLDDVISNLKFVYDNNCLVYISEKFGDCEDISIDCALMEKIPEKIIMIKFEGLWSDIGSYNSLINYSKPCINYKSNNNYTNTEKKLIINNLSNIAVVETNDVILVSNLNKSQEIKNLYDHVKSHDINMLINSHTDYQPWGHYEVLKDSDFFKSKKITVYPNKRLSLQSHNYRSEHWICIKGNGVAQINDNFIDLSVNTQVFINIGNKHRLINNGNEELVIIEIQTGTYFGEDDIIRYEDDYYRI